MACLFFCNHINNKCVSFDGAYDNNHECDDSVDDDNDDDDNDDDDDDDVDDDDTDCEDVWQVCKEPSILGRNPSLEALMGPAEVLVSIIITIIMMIILTR